MAGRTAKLRILRKVSSDSSSPTLQQGQPYIDATQTPGRFYVGQGGGGIDDSEVQVKEADHFTEPVTMSVNLNKYGAYGYDASEEIVLGCTGTLPTSRGGTGSNTFNVNNVGEGVLKIEYGGTGNGTEAGHAVTPDGSDSSTRIATTEFVQSRCDVVQDKCDDNAKSLTSSLKSDVQDALDTFADEINDSILNFKETTFTVAGVADAGSVKRLAGVVLVEISASGLGTGSGVSWYTTGSTLGTIPTGYRPMSELQSVPFICGDDLNNSYNKHYAFGYCTIGTNGVITVTDYDVNNASYGTSSNHTLHLYCGYSCSDKPSVTAPTIK